MNFVYKLKYICVIAILTLTIPAFSQSKPGISDTCDVLTLWGGGKIYCHIKEINDHSVVYWPCSDSANFLKSIWRDRVHLLIHPSNSFIIVTEDSIPHRLFGNVPDDIVDQDVSLKKMCIVNAGIGNSIIGIRVYGVKVQAGGTVSQGIVYNAFVDYGINKNMTVGLACTSQNLKGIPVIIATQGIQNVNEDISRYNCGLRALTYITHTARLQIYAGARVGVSYWRDIVSDQFYQRSATISDKSFNPSIQCLLGIRIMLGVVGFHTEIAIGAPYTGTIGFSFKI
jgi:hypothetical protein